MVDFSAIFLVEFPAFCPTVSTYRSSITLIRETDFAWSMVLVALTGVILDVVRLGFFAKQNPTKYAGYTMPSTYPARLGFLFVGLCLLYILPEVTPPGVFRRQPGGTAVPVVPSLIVVTGLVLTVLITK